MIELDFGAVTIRIEARRRPTGDVPLHFGFDLRLNLRRGGSVIHPILQNHWNFNDFIAGNGQAVFLVQRKHFFLAEAAHMGRVTKLIDRPCGGQFLIPYDSGTLSWRSSFFRFQSSSPAG